MDRDAYIQLDRIEAKIDYLVHEFEEVFPKEETEEDDENEETEQEKKEKRHRKIDEEIEQMDKPKVKTSTKNAKSEFVDIED